MILTSHLSLLCPAQSVGYAPLAMHVSVSPCPEWTQVFDCAHHHRTGNAVRGLGCWTSSCAGDAAAPAAPSHVWAGADGCYSAVWPLSGAGDPATSTRACCTFLFGDTFLHAVEDSEVAAGGSPAAPATVTTAAVSRPPNATMVHNTIATLKIARTGLTAAWLPEHPPAPRFQAGADKDKVGGSGEGEGAAGAFAVALGNPEHWLWPQAMLVLPAPEEADHELELTSLLLEVAPDVAATAPDGFQFRTAALCEMRVPIAGGAEPRLRAEQMQLRPPSACLMKQLSCGGMVYFGAAALVHDGFVYIYGRHESAAVAGPQLVSGLEALGSRQTASTTHKTISHSHPPPPSASLQVVARVPTGEYHDHGRWRFFSGGAWVEDIAAAQPLGEGGAEFSVTKLDKTCFLLTYMLMHTGLCVAVAETPWGPFCERSDVWRAPECDERPRLYCYNAKVHAELSTIDPAARSASLLASYNVNSLDFADVLQCIDIYRPRFVWLDIVW